MIVGVMLLLVCGGILSDAYAEPGHWKQVLKSAAAKVKSAASHVKSAAALGVTDDGQAQTGQAAAKLAEDLKERSDQLKSQFFPFSLIPRQELLAITIFLVIVAICAYPLAENYTEFHSGWMIVVIVGVIALSIATLNAYIQLGEAVDLDVRVQQLQSVPH